MHCETRRVLGIKDHHGILAEYACLPLNNLISVPDSVSDEAAVFVEPLAAALEIQAQIEKHHPLNEAPAAFEHAARPGALKIVVKMVEID